MTEDYKLANRARHELERRNLRAQILSATPEQALDMVLGASSPAILIQSFPDQDLYYLMHKVGVHDFIPVLALASSEQWEYILDVEVWEDDRIDLHLMTQVLDLLFKADAGRLLRWSITQKPEFIEYFLFHNMSVVIREHDEIPPEDFDDYITLDDTFYFRFPDRALPNEETGELLPGETPEDEPRHEDAPELIEAMLRTLAGMDLSVFHGLLQETTALLPAEAEEEEFRLRNIRLAEKGFLPFHEAIGIYQPAPVIRRRPRHTPPQTDPESPLPPQFFAQYLTGDTLLFLQALERFRQRRQARPDMAGPDIADIHNELAALVNKIISADRVKMRKPEDIRDVMAKACAYLSLGLEVLTRGTADAETACDILFTTFLEDIFRTGSREGIHLKTRAMAWFEKSFIKGSRLPLSFLGESYLGVLGGLFIERPMFFANYANRELYRDFRTMADIRATGRLLDEIMALDQLMDALSPDFDTFSKGVLSYKSLILTLWAKDRMNRGGHGDLSPIPLSDFRPFFGELFENGTPREDTGQDLAQWASDVLDLNSPSDLPPALQSPLFSLLQELGTEYGPIKPKNMDIRFIPHFLLTGGDDD